MFFHLLHHVASYVIPVAEASQPDGIPDKVYMAPGFTWNVGFGQLIQLGGIVLSMAFYWNKTQIRHAMQLRDMSEVRRDVTQLAGRVEIMDNYVRQLPAILAATERGQKPSMPPMAKIKGVMGVPNNFEEQLREELGDDLDAETTAKVFEGLKKVFGREA